MTFVTVDTPVMCNTSGLPNNTYIRSTRCGKHKIFIGMAPGVGKTCKMLDEAHRLKRDGIDVVVGCLETHDRQDTFLKVLGLEVIPSTAIAHDGLTLTEMDTDAILERQPQLVLIDELAHTNVFGSRREQRYQDVEAILAAGIDVYSTVNIQHLESLNHQVTNITGLVVLERIPNRILEVADEVVVVDVTPMTLEKRLQDGKIYPLEKIEQKVQSFFQHRNLVALRELVLREVADKIEERGIREATQLNCKRENSTLQICCVHERILVCISTDPNSLRLIRRGARFADYMNAPLHVLFVNNPDRFLTQQEAYYIENCKQLCLKFKGKFLQVAAHNTVEQIVKVAKSYRITQILLGQSRCSYWQTLLRGSVVNQLVRSLTSIDIHIISIK